MARPVFLSPAPASGGEAVIDSLRGRPVVVNFWATRRARLRGTPRAHRRGAATSTTAGVPWWSTRTSLSSLRDFLKERGAAYPTLMDPGSKTAIAYGVFGVPEAPPILMRSVYALSNGSGPLDRT